MTLDGGKGVLVMRLVNHTPSMPITCTCSAARYRDITVHALCIHTCTAEDIRYDLECVYIYGTVSAKIAPRLKCYKIASRLNHYNVPTDNAIDFLFSTLHSQMV